MVFALLSISNRKIRLPWSWGCRLCRIFAKIPTKYVALLPGYHKFYNIRYSGFGGLEVSVLAFGTRVRGFKPGRSRRIFSDGKILSAPSFGGEVKPSVPCRKRTQKWRGSRHFRQNSWKFLAYSSTCCCCGSLASFQTLGTPCGGGWNVLITGPPCWGFDVLLATALCKNLPTENTQR